VVLDHTQNPVIGPDGLPLRAYPPVIGANGEPVVDDAGNVVRQAALSDTRYVGYWLNQPNQNQLNPILVGGQTIQDFSGNLVREMPVMNGAYYTEALRLIVNYTPGLPHLQAATLNALSDGFRAHPVPEYTPVAQRDPQSGAIAVTFTPELTAALQSPHERIRTWALERIIETFNQRHTLLNIGGGNNAGVPVYAALHDINGYTPTVDITVDQSGRGITKVTLGAYHKSMFRSATYSVRLRGESLAEYVTARYRPGTQVGAVLSQVANRDIHQFTIYSEQSSGQSFVMVPTEYDSWLCQASLQDLRSNLQRLGTLIGDQVGAPQMNAIALGFAKYLVRNIASLPRQHIERVLYSWEVLSLCTEKLHQPGPRHNFLSGLSQSDYKNRRIPGDIQNEVAYRLLVMARNDWALKKVLAANRNPVQRLLWVGTFAEWASKNRVDVCDRVIAYISAPQNYKNYETQIITQNIDRFANERTNNPAERQQAHDEAMWFMNWLIGWLPQQNPSTHLPNVADAPRNPSTNLPNVANAPQ
jgi:hypothetical protein